jgi:quinol monooxygenase YgiN
VTTVASVLVVLRFVVDNAEEEFIQAAHTALEALAAATGYRRGQLARAFDDPSVWCLVTEWASVGAYRRALGSYDVKVRSTPLLARARAEESAFEPLAMAEPGQPVTTVGSDRSGIASRP